MGFFCSYIGSICKTSCTSCPQFVGELVLILQRTELQTEWGYQEADPLIQLHYFQFASLYQREDLQKILIVRFRACVF